MIQRPGRKPLIPGKLTGYRLAIQWDLNCYIPMFAVIDGMCPNMLRSLINAGSLQFFLYKKTFYDPCHESVIVRYQNMVKRVREVHI